MKIGNTDIDFSTPVVMTIVNVTPDSFFEGSRTCTDSEIETRVRTALSQGARIIDIGGYSSRPGADDVPVDEETRRVLRGVEIVRGISPDTVISIDTFRSQVAETVISRFGACIVNDISAAEADSAIIDVVAYYGVPYIAMHSKGTPATMQSMTRYDDMIGEITDFFRAKLSVLHKRGVRDVIIDPGFGFAKTTEQNYLLLRHMDALKQFGCPIMAGISRKSMIYKVLDTTPQNSLNGTSALHWECLMRGADILRVHDTQQAAEVIRLFDFYKKQYDK